MLSNYSPPSLTIEQRLERIIATTAPRMGGIVIGPQYLLSRYGKEEVPATAFNAAGMSLPYAFKNAAGATTTLPAGYAADLDSVKVDVEGLEASLASFSSGGTPHFNLNDLSTPNVIKISAGAVAGTNLATLFRGRNAQIGDLVYVTDDVAAVRRRKIKSLLGVDLPSSYGTNADRDNADIANNSYNPANEAVVGTPFVSVSNASGFTLSVANISSFSGTVRGSKYGNRYGEEFRVTVRTSGLPAAATVDISSASGLWNATDVPTVNSSGNFSITNSNAAGEIAGLNLLITPTTPGSALTQGQVFVFRAFHAYVRLTDANMAVTGTYGGSRDTTYLIQVVQGSTGGTFVGATLRISDSAGLETPTDVVINSNTQAIALGANGLTLTLAPSGSWEPQGGFRAGDGYYIYAKAAAASTTSFDKIVLDGPVVDSSTFTDISTGLATEFRLAYSGPVLKTADLDGEAWEATASDVDIEAGLSLNVPERSSSYQWVPYVTNVGTVSLSWRATVPTTSTETVKVITSTDDITAYFGTIDPDNVLAYGAYEALVGANGSQISALNTGGVTAARFQAAFKKLESTNSLTFLGILSTSPDVHAAAKAHVDTMSTKENMKFRRAYIPTDSPGDYAVATKGTDGSTLLATVTDYGGQNLLVTNVANNLDFTLLNLETGDLFELPGSGISYVISEVISETELLLVAGPQAPIAPAQPFEIWKDSGAESQADFVREVSRSLSDRRCVNVWQESGTKLISGTVPTLISNMFQVAYVTGLRAGLRPQEGTTRRPITSITSAPAMHTKYNPSLLNQIAADGTFIITQDIEGGPVYVRHQLTTDTSNGPLYSEDTPGIVGDYISFLLYDLINPDIGRKNVNRRTVEGLEGKVINLLEQQKLVDLDADYGPAINNYDNLTVGIDPVLRDRINVAVTIYVGLPLNSVAVQLNISVEIDTALAA